MPSSHSKISWTQLKQAHLLLEISDVILQGDNSVGEFYSVALTSLMQQADTGTKMIHIGKNTKSTIISRNLAQKPEFLSWIGKSCPNSKRFKKLPQCDSLLIGLIVQRTLFRI